MKLNNEPAVGTLGPIQWERVERLFWGALDVPVAQRSAFLESATDDEYLRAQVRLLLEAHQSVTSQLGLNLKDFSHVGQVDADSPNFGSGDLLCGRYEILRLVGQGGMGRVYEAEDRELGERIAIKTVHPHDGSVADAYERLKRELQVMRRLTHVNICRVFDIARDQSTRRDVLFFTMEMLRGSTVADRLKAGQKLPLEQVAPLVAPLVSALETAHAHGIVHRDLKPGNIMLVEQADGAMRPVIMDFGIARVLALPNLTLAPSSQTQDAAGTPAYMAPEQLLGRAITGATDFYSLGLVLYEMLCGRSPSPTASQLQAIFQRIDQPPPDPRVHVPDLPENWAQLIIRLLDRDPGRRPRSSSNVAALIGTDRARPFAATIRFVKRAKWLTAAVLVSLILVGLIGFLWLLQKSSVNKPARLQRVAMLPFAAAEASSDRDDAAASGFSAALSGRLAAMVPRDAAAWITQDEVAAQHVADVASARRQLGADKVVSGSLMRTEKGLRDVVSLADTATGKILKTFEIEAPDYDKLLSDSAAHILSDLDITAKASSKAATADAIAQAEYIEALGFFDRSDKPQALELAVAALNQAVRRDPRFIEARILLVRVLRTQFERQHDRLKLDEAEHQLDLASQIAPREASIHVARGELHIATGNYAEAINELHAAQDSGLTTGDLFVALARAYNGVGLTDKAEAGFREAIRLNPQSWSARSFLAQFYYRRGLYEKSAEEFKGALRLAPDNARILFSLGGVLLQLGRFDESRTYLMKAASIHPTAPVWINLGTLNSKVKQWAAATAYFEKALEADPSNYQVWASLADAYAHLPGQDGKSQDAYRRAAEICRKQLQEKPSDAHLLADLASFLAQTGKRQEALELIQRALALASSDTVVMVTAGEVYELLGFRTEALEWVKTALQHGFPREGIDGDQALDALRSDSRFAVMAAQIRSGKK